MKIVSFGPVQDIVIFEFNGWNQIQIHNVWQLLSYSCHIVKCLLLHCIFKVHNMTKLALLGLKQI